MAKARKRELIEPRAGDKRFVRRGDGGRFDEVVDAGRSMAQDRKQRSKTVSKSGFGDKGDRATTGAKKKAGGRKKAAGAARKTAGMKKAGAARKTASRPAAKKKAGAARKTASRPAAKKKAAGRKTGAKKK